MDDYTKGRVTILTAPWVVPIESPVLCNGGVAVSKNVILAVGTREELVKKFPDALEKKYKAVLMPGLINAHIHLELSHLKDISKPLPTQNFTDWVASLLLQKIESEVSTEQVEEEFSNVLVDQFNSGVIIVADIGNEYFPVLHEAERNDWPLVLRMLEFIGPNEQTFLSGKEMLNELSDRVSATAHAPYSTTSKLLVELKKRCTRLQHIFSIHTAESCGEKEFLSNRTGYFRDFLDKRKSWDGSFFKDGDAYSGTIHYYEHLGILDEKTLLVHCIHVSDEELQIVHERGSKICLCPGSNTFLNVGCAPVEKILNVGILPALGTDSIASNEGIDLWREMQILAEQHPALSAATILAMATIGGARALHYDFEFGSLLRGKSARFIHVSSPRLDKCNNENELTKELVSGGQPMNISWVDTVH